MNRKQERERKLRKIKAGIIAVLLLAASLGLLITLYDRAIKAFNVFLWIFGSIGFIHTMILLVTWIDDLSIDHSQDFDQWFEK